MSRRLMTRVIAVLLLAGACGGSPREGALSLPPRDGGVAVTEAMASGSTVGWIRGYLLAERGQPVRLCEALTESVPPGCGGAVLVLRDGVLWRQPYSDAHPFGEMPPGGAITDAGLTMTEPCGYEANGPCAALLGVSASGDVMWTDVAYSVIGTVAGDELHRLKAPPGSDL